MRFGSVCSGIEAASVAWHPLGWKAAWLSEIEPFPSAVLKHHYPDVPNLGDMTTLPERILSGEVEAPDVFCGGTPCQAFSVAGLRKSLDDARGNLSLTFVGIANAIDHVRSVRSANPAIIFWENVPGVLNTKDNAFGCFLAALAGEDDALVPSGQKWTNAGCVFGPQRTVAWRVLDAQYFGVAQRRRRVFVVASARADFNPAAVLFEFEGVRRDTAPSREAGKKPTASLVPSVAGSLDTECGGGKLTHQSVANGHLIGTITARMFSALGTRDVEAGAIMPVVSPSLNTCSGSHHAPDTKAYVVQPINFGAQMSVPQVDFDLCQTLQAKNPMAVAQPTYGIPNNWIGRAPENGGNAVEPMHDISPCLTSADRHGVVQPIPINSMNALRGADADPTTGCGIGEAGEAMFTITKAHSHAVAFGTDLYNGNITGDVAATMGTPGSSINASGPTVMQAMQVRRLTPVECERLQGFPDNYTDIKPKGKPTPDGPRYKALGNSWAVPVVRWIGSRIQEQVDAP